MITLSASATISSGNVFDATTDNTNNIALILDGGNNKLNTYNLATGALITSASVLASLPRSVVSVNNGASAFIAYFNTNSVSLMELPSGFRTDISGGTSINNISATKKAALNPVTGNVVWSTDATGTISKLVISTHTASNITIDVCVNDLIYSIAYYGNSHFLIGTEYGRIYEIDENGVIYNEAAIQLPTTITGVYQGGSIVTPQIASISVDNNLVLIATLQGTLHLWDWSTRTELQMIQVGVLNSSILISPSASGEVIFTHITSQQTTNSYAPIYELDFTINPLTVRSTAFTSTITGYQGMNAMNSTNGQFVVCKADAAQTLIFGYITPRASTVQTLSSPGNVPVDITILDDLGTSSSVILNTYMASPGNYRLPTGRNILEIIKSGDGTDAQWSVRSYAT